MKKLLIFMLFLLPIEAYAATLQFGSSTAVIENRKEDIIFSLENTPTVDEMTFTLDSEEEPVPISDEDLIMDEPDPAPESVSELMFTAEEQDLADTLLSDEVREEESGG